MARRSTPERIDTAREAATRRRGEMSGMTGETADAWITAWHVKARGGRAGAWGGVLGRGLGLDHGATSNAEEAVIVVVRPAFSPCRRWYADFCERRRVGRSSVGISSLG